MRPPPAGALSPWQRYQQDLTAKDFVHDPAQERAVRRIQALYEELLKRDGAGRWSILLRRLRPAALPRGLYLWGGVGRGKTYLMDRFYESLPLSSKRRVHFHRFMEDVHDRLREQQNATDPLIPIAKDLAQQAQVLCFDEFFVVDIADAMILAGLLKALFDAGVVLLATSNTPPIRLYEDGLQRARFLPAIALLGTHVEVIEVNGPVDYRLRILDRAEIYHWPLDNAAEQSLWRSFCELAPGEFEEGAIIHVNHREVRTRAAADGVALIEFSELCDTPRGPSDYIEFARRFNTLLVANVPQMKDGMNDPARRFINLVDEMYDRGVNLIISAQVAIDELYTGERLAFEFRRTSSRLNEMQTREYLAREHCP